MELVYRYLKEIRLGDEKIAVVAFWQTGSMGNLR